MCSLQSEESVIALLVLAVLSTSRIASTARILGVLPFPCQSHGILGNTLLKELARKGHQVTMISSFPPEDKVNNFRHIYIELEASTKIRDGVTAYKFPLMQIYPLLKYISDVDDLLLSDKNVKGLLSSGEKFDLVLNMGMDSLLGLSHAVNASTVRFNVLGMYSVHAALSMNPLPPAYVPNILVPYSEDMDLFQRTMNTITNLLFDLYIEFYWKDTENAIIQKHFPGAPHLSKLQQHVHVTLVNSHMAIENARPYLTNVIPIGGFHLHGDEELPTDLKQFLDNATEGVILFSLGSSIKAKILRGKLKVMLKCFASLPYKILWKNDGNVDGQPDNVKTMKWFPQKGVLKHPNVKLFITHGGLGSVIESVYYAVPMIILPFVLDQQGNAVQCVHNGYAIKLNPETLTEDELQWAIKEITTNPTYLDEIAMRSDAIRHQEVSPMEKAIYWIERIIKDKQPNYLKCMAKQMPLHQYYLFDVFGLIIFCISCMLCISLILFKVLLKYWSAMSSTKEKAS